MTTAELVVTLAGVAAIAWVNWYFFLARPRAPTPEPPGRGDTPRP
ncbi:MAG TPA: hypothetical protein VNK43_05900 [Gemmatimonadales bacterium]|nr:hypothetical protein [Gemmatimonadales bacterium]